jgi:hypothetical protein
MTIDLFDRKFCSIHTICIDDDASTRAMLKWNNADYMTNNNTTDPPTSSITKGPNAGKMQARPDKGRLPAHIPEPLFVADPNHRKKVLTGELYSLASAVVSKKHTMTKNDATRIGKNFGYMIRNLYKLDGDEAAILKAGKAILEHQFDNHEYCGRWCPRRRMTEEQLAASERFYRCKTKDAKLYAILNEKVGWFLTLPRLMECCHRMDTQVNESFNNIAAWMAPKNKVYCGSSSLTNRLGISIGIKSIGLMKYFKRLFLKLGILMTPNVAHFLQTKDKTRFARIEKIKTKEHKKARLQGRFTKQKEDEVIAKRERSKRDGTYKSGQHVLQDGDEEQQQQPPRKKAKNKNDLKCKSCGMIGHATTRSSKCINHIARPVREAVAANKTCGYVLTEADQAEDVANFDTFGFQEDAADDDNGPQQEALQGLLAMTTANDSRTIDSDGEDLYGPSTSTGPI